MSAKAPPERLEEMLSFYYDGFTYQQIGDLYGLTRARVQQILARHITRWPTRICEICGATFESKYPRRWCDGCKCCDVCGKPLAAVQVGKVSHHPSCDPDRKSNYPLVSRVVEPGIYARFRKDGRRVWKYWTSIDGKIEFHETIEEARAHRERHGFRGDGRRYPRDAAV